MQEGHTHASCATSVDADGQLNGFSYCGTCPGEEEKAAGALVDKNGNGLIEVRRFEEVHPPARQQRQGQQRPSAEVHNSRKGISHLQTVMRLGPRPSENLYVESTLTGCTTGLTAAGSSSPLVAHTWRMLQRCIENLFKSLGSK